MQIIFHSMMFQCTYFIIGWMHLKCWGFKGDNSGNA